MVQTAGEKLEFELSHKSVIYPDQLGSACSKSDQKHNGV